MIVLVTGGFDPIHSGHIEYINSAKTLGGKLVVGLNSDDWLIRKKGKNFLSLKERKKILLNLRAVDHVIEFDDSDDTAIDAIETVKKMYGQKTDIIFANGGDRGQSNIPEYKKYSIPSNNSVSFAFGVGGDNKLNSSSHILEEWKAPKTFRKWGYYKVIHEDNPEVKVKEMVVYPQQHLSMQKHHFRNELWFVAEGTASLYTINISSDVELVGEYKQHARIDIQKNSWHMLANETYHPLKIIEIQYGDNCVEEDMERNDGYQTS